MGKRKLSFSEELLGLLDRLSSEKIPFLIVGGIALVLHGIPRSTLDIDIFIPAEEKVIASLFKAAKALKLKTKENEIQKLISKLELLEGQWVTFKNSEKREVLDVFLEEPATFRKLFSRGLKRRKGKTVLYVVSLKDLEAIKRASGRPIDYADIALIQERLKLNK
ncbi:MAG: DUF6036 family nucleotidyltransferase [Candidatus Omnitrophota bacterium]